MHMQVSEGGPYIIALAYVMSCIGCGMGLSSMVRARSAVGRLRRRWLLLGAISIGGTGIWVMHFIAMLGFTLPNVQTHFNIPITVASLAVAITVVWFGLRAAADSNGSIASLIPAGLVTGVGVAGMHYVGMAAMTAQASMHYRIWVVALSVVIAVVAATVALWFAANLHAAASMLGAALLMGVAVTGMHYTGMAAMEVTTSTRGASSSLALTSTQLIAPLAAVVTISTLAILLTIGLSPNAEEIEQEARVAENLRKLAAMRETEESPLAGADRQLGQRRAAGPRRR